MLLSVVFELVQYNVDIIAQDPDAFLQTYLS
jgi:hypothetical protein